MLAAPGRRDGSEEGKGMTGKEHRRMALCTLLDYDPRRPFERGASLAHF